MCVLLLVVTSMLLLGLISEACLMCMSAQVVFKSSNDIGEPRQAMHAWLKITTSLASKIIH